MRECVTEYVLLSLRVSNLGCEHLWANDKWKTAKVGLETRFYALMQIDSSYCAQFVSEYMMKIYRDK